MDMFGDKLKMFRSKREISQSELALYLGVSQQAVGKWEHNTTIPDVNNLIKLADYYSSSLDELVGRNQFEVADQIPIYDSVNVSICYTDDTKEKYYEYNFNTVFFMLLERPYDESLGGYQSNDYFAYLVSGDEMKPSYSKFDTIIFKKTNRFLQNGDYLFIYNDVVYFRRLCKDKFGYLAYSYNSKIEPFYIILNGLLTLPIGKSIDIIDFSAEEMDSYYDPAFQIIARATSIRRDIK